MKVPGSLPDLFGGVDVKPVSRDIPSVRNAHGDRVPFDLYPTPPCLIRALIENVDILDPVWEPAAGDGRLGHAMTAAGYTVTMSDIHPTAPGIATADFLDSPVPPSVRSIVTNGPFALIDQFIRRGLEHLDAGRIDQLVLLGRHDLDAAAGRADLMQRARQRIRLHLAPTLDHWKHRSTPLVLHVVGMATRFNRRTSQHLRPQALAESDEGVPVSADEPPASIWDVKRQSSAGKLSKTAICEGR